MLRLLFSRKRRLCGRRTGRVTNIRTVSGLPYGLTEKAINAARKIYFLPAIKDGRRVPQYIRVEYNFNIY
jgi:outer membrane biosynthesis protein TonB